jgi:hypothetical protein
MISFSDNILFFSFLLIGSIGFAIAVFATVYNLEKDNRKIHKTKKA